MPQVFIALENTASAFGLKKANTQNKPESKANVSKHAEKAKEQVYQQRRDLAEKLGFDFKKDSSEGFGENNIHFIVRTLASKRGYSYGVAGSLPSLFKRLSFEANQKKLPFDTLIFLGHGNTGLMTVGLGRFPAHELKHERDQELLQIEKRMINVSDDSKAHWTQTFHDHKSSLGVGKADKVLHIMFMGCATGNMSDISFKVLPKVTSAAISALLDCDVICYGADRLIENKELEAAISHVEAITSEAASSGALQGSISLDGSEASLEWYRKNAG